MLEVKWLGSSLIFLCPKRSTASTFTSFKSRFKAGYTVIQKAKEAFIVQSISDGPMQLFELAKVSYVLPVWIDVD